MYSTCLFCHGELGTNEVVEHFPIGRRLAFDAAKGRLWVVCKSCARWNLTPLEERWEAIEECERLFRSTTLRMSTEHIGLARVREGLELVRIGDPQRPEMAAWRYGDQFGQRRRKYFAYTAGALVVGGAVIAGGIQVGLFAGAGVNLINVANFARNVIWARRTVAHVPTSEGRARVARGQLQSVRVTRARGGAPVLQFDRKLSPGETLETASGVPWWRFNGSPRGRRLMRGITIEIPLADSAPALSALLPAINANGGSRKTVADAVQLLDTRGTYGLLHDLTTAATTLRWYASETGQLARFPRELRLALEMATHEDQERAAMEGELAALEERWREAEEIAAIADDMFLPRSITDWVSHAHERPQDPAPVERGTIR